MEKHLRAAKCCATLLCTCGRVYELHTPSGVRTVMGVYVPYRPLFSLTSLAVLREETCVQRAAFFVSTAEEEQEMPSVEKLYKGRPSGIATVNFSIETPEGSATVNYSIEKEALVILERHAAGPKARGRFISRLLYDYQARREAKEEMREELLGVLTTHDETSV
jgi:hypothetical protein